MFYSTSESFNLLSDLLIVNDFLEVTKGLTCCLSQYCFLFFEMEATISDDFSVCPCFRSRKEECLFSPCLRARVWEVFKYSNIHSITNDAQKVNCERSSLVQWLAAVWRLVKSLTAGKCKQIFQKADLTRFCGCHYFRSMLVYLWIQLLATTSLVILGDAIWSFHKTNIKTIYRVPTKWHNIEQSLGIFEDTGWVLPLPLLLICLTLIWG